MNRTEAIEAASKVVNDLAPMANSRGYADGTLRPAERVEAVLRVADWFLSDEADLAAAVNRLTETNPEAARALRTLFAPEVDQ